ncbi:MAG: hypothetical protein RIK87_25835 [Fuerstiella sp.]
MSSSELPRPADDGGAMPNSGLVIIDSDADVYCLLKAALEPAYRVTAEPQTDYFAEWKFCYRIFDGDALIEELAGDFRTLPAGCLAARARDIVARLSDRRNHQVRTFSAEGALPFASRLPPRHGAVTWFSSGRAAFAWLIENVVKPRTVYLPTYVCWSLMDVMRRRFPSTNLKFYSVRKDLRSEFPKAVGPDEAILYIHYFGHRHPAPTADAGGTLLEDCSHQPLPRPALSESMIDGRTSTSLFTFGSLRKAYRVADGGFLLGQFCPVYEPDRHLDAWLRLQAADWRELREAENMTDRHWSVSDISGQSLAVVLQADVALAGQRRQANNEFLERHFPCGTALLSFRTDESPLLHSRVFESPQERDSLRQYLAGQGIFTSIHWPVHEHLRRQQDDTDIEDALWLESHTMTIPVAEDFGKQHMAAVCDAVRAWSSAGSIRFTAPAVTPTL